MEENPSNMDVVEETPTPTPSQEQKLLEEATEATNTTIPNVPNVEKSSMPPANLRDLKLLIESSANAGENEMSMSLQTGEVSVTKPQQSGNRTRSEKARNIARKNRKPNIDPHDRVKNTNDTPKREREIGSTPPSHRAPNKKSKAETTEGNTSNQKPLSKNQKQRLKAKLKKNAARQKAGEKPKASEPTPPPASKPGSNGAGAPADGITAQNAQSSTDVVAKSLEQEPMEHDVGENPQTYADVANNHCVAIIDQRQPGSMQLLDQQRSDKINTLLTDKIMSMVGSRTEMPVFDDYRPHGGAVRVRCANSYTRKWLESNVPLLDVKKLWNGAKLVVIDFKDIPKPHKFNVFVRGVLRSAKDILSLLQSQNVGINTKSWSILHSNRAEGGTRMTIGVGQDSFEFLQKNANSLHCGMGKAQFTVVKGWKVNRTNTQSAATSNEAATNATEDANQQQQAEIQSNGTVAVDNNANDSSANGAKV